MKSTGIIRKVDEVGRFVLPIETRRVLGITDKSEIEIFVENNSIILKKHESSCVFCNGKKNLIEYKDKYICKQCLTDLSE